MKWLKGSTITFLGALGFLGCAHETEGTQPQPVVQEQMAPQPGSMQQPQLQQPQLQQPQSQLSQQPPLQQPNQPFSSEMGAERQPVAGRDLMLNDESGRMTRITDPMLIRQVKQKLADQGCNPGTIDSKVDPKLQSALVQCQNKLGVQASGMIDQPTAKALGLDWASFKAPSAPPPVNP
jgi:hypothetical protein